MQWLPYPGLRSNSSSWIVLTMHHSIFSQTPDIPMDIGTLLLRNLTGTFIIFACIAGIVNAYIAIAVAYTPASIVVVGHHPLLVGAVNFLLDIPYKFLENRRLEVSKSQLLYGLFNQDFLQQIDILRLILVLYLFIWSLLTKTFSGIERSSTFQRRNGSGMKRFLWSRCCEKEEQELVFAADLTAALCFVICIGIHFSFPSKHPG